jgi:hypothetical protein
MSIANFTFFLRPSERGGLQSARVPTWAGGNKGSGGCHSLTARVFEGASVARTERSFINWRQPNKMGLARLEEYFDPNERDSCVWIWMPNRVANPSGWVYGLFGTENARGMPVLVFRERVSIRSLTPPLQRGAGVRRAVPAPKAFGAFRPRGKPLKRLQRPSRLYTPG